DRLPHVAAARLHAAVGDALAAADPDAHGAAVAMHLERAAPLGRAAEAVAAAGHAEAQALRHLAAAEAAEQVQRAIRLVPDVDRDPARLVELHRRLVQHLLVAEGYSSANLRAAASRLRE